MEPHTQIVFLQPLVNVDEIPCTLAYCLQSFTLC